MQKQAIAILGANSHIAKGLISRFVTKADTALAMFTRHPDKVVEFLSSIGKQPNGKCLIENDYRNFIAGCYDVVINCVGTGTPNRLGNDRSVWFTLTEEFDNLSLNYLRNHPNALYVNFSSGAVYGGDGSTAVEENTFNAIPVNHIPKEDYYAIARLNSEAKHRSLERMKIVDLRIFSYFSRFIDLNAGYFITAVLNCAKNETVFETNEANIVRDYIHPDDLFSLLLHCMNAAHLNQAFDAISTKPVEKFQILNFFAATYGLQYRVIPSMRFDSPNGFKLVYCSTYNAAGEIGHTPKFSSMETLMHEAKYVLLHAAKKGMRAT